MMFCRFIKFLYAMPIAMTVYRERALFGEGTGGVATIPLTNELIDKPDWKNVKNMLGRIERAIEEDIEATKAKVILGNRLAAWLERTAPMTGPAWRSEGDQDTLRFVMALETNPLVACLLGGGMERQHFEMGGLWWMKQDAWHNLHNFGSHAAVHLFVDFKGQET